MHVASHETDVVQANMTKLWFDNSEKMFVHQGGFFSIDLASIHTAGI